MRERLQNNGPSARGKKVDAAPGLRVARDNFGWSPVQ
jgi:hypothetical protein